MAHIVKGLHSCICPPASLSANEMNHAFAFPSEAGPHFADPDRVGWLHTDGSPALPARRRSPIQVLIGPDVD